MYRAPPKKTPRVAGVAIHGKKTALVVLDPYELRVAMVGTPLATLRRALLREGPLLVAASRPWPWLRRTGIALAVTDPPAGAPAFTDYPELRRFGGTKDEQLLSRALGLADLALTQALHEQHIPQN